MPLSATFHFFFPFHFQEEISYITYLSNPFHILFYYISLIFYSLFNQQCISATIFVILLLLLKDNKKLQVFADVQNSLKMKDIA